jgi:hypothetical protein
MIAMILEIFLDAFYQSYIMGPNQAGAANRGGTIPDCRGYFSLGLTMGVGFYAQCDFLCRFNVTSF